MDSVLAIRKGLTGGQEKAATAATAAGGAELREKVEEVAVRSQAQTTNGNGNSNGNGNGDGAVVERA